MKFFTWIISFFLSSRAFANPACTTVCPIVIGFFLVIAEKLGVPKEVVGVFSGALLATFGYMMIRFCEKRNWNFPARNFILMSLSISSIGFIYINTSPYSPMLYWHLLYIDPFLLAALCGACAHILGVHIYAWLKAKNGGHAHFPFEKVVIPILLDIFVCWLFWGTTLCQCYTLEEVLNK